MTAATESLPGGKLEGLPDAGIRATFEARYGQKPVVARAPGRINLIGEHTDYNGGLVMPAALSFFSWVAAAPRQDGRIVVHSARFDETVECPLADIGRRTDAVHWADYPLGVARCLVEAGVPLGGASLMLEGNVPIGAGLSSSASLEVATAGALLAIAQHSLDPTDIAVLCQRAENEYVGMRCGIMDQYIAVFGRAGFALQIDCQRLEHLEIPFSFASLPANEQPRLLICDTGRKHELAGSEYNVRRAESEAALAALQAVLPAARALCGISCAQLTENADLLNAVQYRRARHAVSENERVRAAGEALRSGDAVRMGQLMYASHTSLRDDYQVSCAEVDCLVEIARQTPGVYGARMTGGGFGGCSVNLVRTDALDTFRQQVTEIYGATYGTAPRFYDAEIADGLRLLGESVS